MLNEDNLNSSLSFLSLLSSKAYLYPILLSVTDLTCTGSKICSKETKEAEDFLLYKHN